LLVRPDSAPDDPRPGALGDACEISRLNDDKSVTRRHRRFDYRIPGWFATWKSGAEPRFYRGLAFGLCALAAVTSLPLFDGLL
jgi:hypothetical protein